MTTYKTKAVMRHSKIYGTHWQGYAAYYENGRFLFGHTCPCLRISKADALADAETMADDTLSHNGLSAIQRAALGGAA